MSILSEVAVKLIGLKDRVFVDPDDRPPTGAYALGVDTTAYPVEKLYLVDDAGVQTPVGGGGVSTCFFPITDLQTVPDSTSTPLEFDAAVGPLGTDFDLTTPTQIIVTADSAGDYLFFLTVHAQLDETIVIFATAAVTINGVEAVLEALELPSPTGDIRIRQFTAPVHWAHVDDGDIIRVAFYQESSVDATVLNGNGTQSRLAVLKTA